MFSSTSSNGEFFPPPPSAPPQPPAAITIMPVSTGSDDNVHPNPNPSGIPIKASGQDVKSVPQALDPWSSGLCDCCHDPNTCKSIYIWASCSFICDLSMYLYLLIRGLSTLFNLLVKLFIKNDKYCIFINFEENKNKILGHRNI